MAIGDARQSGKVYNIVLFSAGAFAPRAFINGLRVLGWVDGHNVRFIPRHTENRPDGLAKVEAELVGLNVDAIVTAGTAGSQTSHAIPIMQAIQFAAALSPAWRAQRVILLA
jgi:putative tryptophan/tyrosine transport system substrate-binding protein